MLAMQQIFTGVVWREACRLSRSFRLSLSSAGSGDRRHTPTAARFALGRPAPASLQSAAPSYADFQDASHDKEARAMGAVRDHSILIACIGAGSAIVAAFAKPICDAVRPTTRSRGRRPSPPRRRRAGATAATPITPTPDGPPIEGTWKQYILSQDEGAVYLGTFVVARGKASTSSARARRSRASGIDELDRRLRRVVRRPGVDVQLELGRRRSRQLRAAARVAHDVRRRNSRRRASSRTARGC